MKKQPSKFIGRKESVYIRKRFNSRRIGLVHRHGCRDARHVKTLPTERETLRNGMKVEEIPIKGTKRSLKVEKQL